MKINDDTNLVLPVRFDEKGVTVYGYHNPISREVFEANYRILSATKSTLGSKGVYFQMDSGPMIAALTLKDEGAKDAESRGEFDAHGSPLDGGAGALLKEIKRLTTILVPGASGWDMVPVDSAISSGSIDEDDWREVESAIVFFTCHYALAKKADRQRLSGATASLLRGSITSLPLTEYLASLLNSTRAEPSRAASSVPS